MKKLDQIVTNNIKNKNQCDEKTEHDPIFDNEFSLSSGFKYHLPVVIVSLRGCKKHRATLISGITCMWDSGAIGSMINTLFRKIGAQFPKTIQKPKCWTFRKK